MVPGFHGLDLVVILVIALLIFGPKKLPEMGSAIGKSIKEFRKGMNELTAGKDKEEEKSPEVTRLELESAQRELERLRNHANTVEAAQPEVSASPETLNATETHSSEFKGTSIGTEL